MGEPGFWDAGLAHFCYRFSQRKMGDVFLVAESIEDDMFAAPDFFSFAFIDAIGIRDIGEIAKTKAQHGHFHMPDLNRLDGDIPDGERVFVNLIEPQVGNAGILRIGEGIGKFSYDRLLCHLIGIEVHGLVLKKIKCPDVIQTGQMVFMRVGEDNCIKVTNTLSQHLVAKIRSGVDGDGSGEGLNENAGAKSFIFLIGRSTHFTGTGYHWNTSAGAGTQECDF